mgnify:CR=1 FL=1
MILKYMEKIIIIGAGPAGISAALYAARANMDPLVINNGIGALEKAEKIENYYGMEHPVSGKELFETGLAQAKALGVRILEAQVLGIGGFDTFTVKTTAGDFDTISVILATGSKRKAPAIPGIKELEGRGVSYCAVCDAFFYRGKDVAVLGNSDFALHEAEELAPMAGSVTIYTDGKEPEFSRKSSFAVNTMKIQSVEGDEKVSGLRLISQSETDAKSDTDEEKNLQLLPEGKKAEMEASELHNQESPVRDSTETFVPADGVFVALGEGTVALYAVLGLTALLIVLIIVFFNHFEKTWIGKLFTLGQRSTTKAGYISNDVLDDLAGKEGVAHTTLRPAGIAKIDGNLVDVVTEGDFIDAGSPIVVLRVVGGRNIVRKRD